MAFFIFIQAFCRQEIPKVYHNETDQLLENLAAQQNGEPEDDSYLQLLVEYQKHKLNLNTASESDLKQLQLISDLQIHSLLQYRTLLGELISIYELQAIPGWDVVTIQKVLPYVTVVSAVPFGTTLQQRLSKGEHSLLVRYQQVLEKSNGFLRPDTAALRYPGSAGRVVFRYKYLFRNLLQFGITADKDAGEQFFKGSQKHGFDFYSFHVFARNVGAIKLVALGDFTVNLGQGLIHWQSLAFKKSGDITAVKRQADILRPYNSTGEFNFMRGAGCTIGLKNVSFTAFASVHKLDGTLNTDTSQTYDDYISSILNSGYHRTATELSKKHTVTQTSFGGNISYATNSLHLGVNAIAFQYSPSLMRNIAPYNQYAIRGDRWLNYSVDYSYTFRNFHFFGEAAMDKNGSKAFVGGLLGSLHQNVDASVVYRNIEKSYQTLYGNAFTESTFPTNENGLFTGVSIRPASTLKIEAYADVFSFPWLRYRVDAPSNGSDYLLQITYKPAKPIEIYSRYKNEDKPINLSGLNLPTRQVFARPKESWRTQITYNISRRFTYTQRTEILWFDPHEKGRSQQGFLLYADGNYRPAKKPVTIGGRIQYFATDGFDSRLYALEDDVLYSYSIPQFIGRGFRYYINLNADINKKMTIWIRWAQSIYANQTSIGSGLDKIDGNKKSEVKLQLMYSF
ncbi:MAG: helix-hairpin-helix domain-containing protein [Bacteroidota bacterium]|nr:helix-hairpin-helix domain-containing protein [Bacteroidota bacterium]